MAVNSTASAHETVRDVVEVESRLTNRGSAFATKESVRVKLVCVYTLCILGIGEIMESYMPCAYNAYTYSYMYVFPEYTHRTINAACI